MIDRLTEKLKHGIVIFDGAIGTEIYKHHFFINACFDNLCLTAPDVITKIHQSYAAAGADVMTTNTFGANRARLATFGLVESIEAINRAGVQLARAAGGEEVLIAGSVGPVFDLVQSQADPLGESVKILREQADILAETGADFILFETFATCNGVTAAVKTAETLTIPYMVSITVDRNGDSAKGEPLVRMIQPLLDAKVPPAAVGLNCGEGPEGMLSALEKLMPMTTFPVIVQPNAGLPKQIDGRLIYMASPEYFATYAIRYANLGARGVGGCCGTGPDHIREIAQSVRPLKKSEYQGLIYDVGVTDVPEKEPVPLDEKSKFSAKLARGEWVTSVEITPPRGFDLSSTVQKAVQCREAGVDAINLPDGPRASSRLSPIVTALEIQRQAKIETVLHCCCRDKNLIGMQADLLGCAAEGIHNILFITGDPPKLGDYPFATAVFDVDSIGIVKIQHRLNRGLDLGGKPFDFPTRTLIGVGADPNAIDMTREIRRLHEKIDAGAEFLMTQPVFDPDALARFLDLANISIPVVAGIWPLASLRNAEFMKNEVPGVVVPDIIMERMCQAQSKEDQRSTGIAIAREAASAIRGIVQGIQVSAPFGNVDTALAVLHG